MFSLRRWIHLLIAGAPEALGGPLAMFAGPGSPDGFQTFVNKELPPGLPGDWAGANIRANFPAGPWAFIASPGGVTIGAACWANPATGVASSYFQPNSAAAFVHREGQAVITQFLGIATMSIVGGDPVTPQVQGDWWGLFAGGCTAGQKVYANPVTGALTANATGNSVGGAITSASLAATGVLTVVTITGTPLAVGQVIYGAGVPPGSYIASLGSGTGGAGTYNLANVDGTAFPVVGAEAMSYAGVQETQFYCAQTIPADCLFTASLALPAAGVAYGVLTVTAIASGVLAPGQYLSATGGGGLAGSANVFILEQLTGTTGSTGTYLVSAVPAVVTSTNTFVATQGKLGKITSWANFW
ncbi:MAG TPA: hypothetical protein VMT50_10615 [Steroidobacteraceae bacterium]|nr:hypothetical protein [Steroidobacteraceae bacterium]